MTRGQRNNNPLNIRKVAGTHWKGEKLPLKGAGGSEFVQFITVEWGIRAAFRLLETYRKKYNAVCIQDIITRWAPPSENNTSAYIKAVCKLTGFGGQERLTAAQLQKLVAAMARIESRMELTDAQLAEGWELYMRN